MTTSGKRVHVREAMIGWRAGASVGDAVRSCEILDVSPSGAFVAMCTDNLEAGQKLSVQGTLRAGPFQIVGRVRWIGKSSRHDRKGVGIEVDAMPVVLRAALSGNASS